MQINREIINNHPMGRVAELAYKCLFMPTCLAGDFDL